jgi:uncharacterized membrane protein
MSQHKGLFAKLRNSFFAGLLFSAPLFLTISLVIWFVQSVNGLVHPLFPHDYFFLEQYIPAYGIIVVFIGSTFIGFLCQGVLGKYLMKHSENLLSKMPVINSIYNTIKQVSQAVLDKDSASFREVGLIEYPRKGTWSLCFITGTISGQVSEELPKGMVNVFVPTTPNPTSGYLLFVPRKEITILDMTVEQGFKMVISMGVIVPPKKIGKKSD